MAILIILCLLTVFLICLGWFWGNVRKAKTKRQFTEVPFGFRGLPGLGLLPFFHRRDFQKTLISMKRQCGKICKVKMGSFDCIFLNDYELIKCAWNLEVFCHRPTIPGILQRTKGFRGGIIFNDGKDFLDQRRFVLHLLKTFGFGKASTEIFVMKEINKAIEQIEEKKGLPMSTRHIFNIATFKIIWRIITGGSSSFDEQALDHLIKILDRHMELNDGARAAVFMPWLTKYFPWFIGWKNYISDANEIFDFWMNFAQETYQTQNTFCDSASLLNAYCDKILTCKDATSSFYQEKGVRSLAIVLQDLFIAGSETTASTIQWALLYLAAFPQYQDKVAEEVLQNIGSMKTPSVHDLEKLPYTEAFIYETLRYSTLAPLGMLHSTSEDVIFHGYFIPKGSIVISNMCAVHYDPEYWTEPDTFMPERFLRSKSGEDLGRGGEGDKDPFESFIPFSIGKRYCPGSKLAKQTLLLAVTSMMQKYCIQIEGNSAVTLSPKIGISAIPQPHELRFIRRQS